MALTLTKRRFTPVEYYRLEVDAANKSDYYDGEIYDMSGGTVRQSQITMNLGAAVWHRLRGGPCRGFDSNLRVAIRATGLRTYPDVSIYCQPVELDPQDVSKSTATNPTVLFEVLSPSTEAYDRGMKSEHYRRIPTLEAYGLVLQTEPRIELWTKSGTTWSNTTVTGMSGLLQLSKPAIHLPLADIYDGVEFD
jgi:Uma2 family endonuclease